MLDAQALSSPQGIPQNMMGTLEAMIEKKIEELLSRVGLSIEEDREDLVPPINTGKASGPKNSGNGTATSKSTKLWSEVAAKSGVGKSQLKRDLIPTRKEGGRGGLRRYESPGRTPSP